MKCPHCGGDVAFVAMARGPLTPAMRRALDVIRAALEVNGAAPTLPELSTALGYSSISSAHQIVQQLVERGWVARIPKMARGLSLVP